MTLPERHVFVYGTLRRGEQRDINLLHPAPRWIGSGGIRGALYDLGTYPGVVLDSGAAEGAVKGAGSVVCGEVYAITPTLERLLDEIEEVWPQQTGEYTRSEVAVTLDKPHLDLPRHETCSPCIVTCLVYCIEEARGNGRFLIAGGDWVAHRLKLGS
jgi:gamma-glutamylcyclotransferase (GGCT)/AIG2-like uncharacterized protein YtfP